jgi:fucose 4-O-acetylase-like acetyltransferase
MHSSQDQHPAGRRIVWVDYARGFGIILVVVGHTLRGLAPAHILEEGPAYRAADTWIYSFHMPLFFFLSGLFAERRIDRRPGVFLPHLLATLGYPYVVWSTLQTLLQMATNRYTNHHYGVSDLFGILVNPIMQFWFLYSLLVTASIYYALRRLGLGQAGILASFVAFWLTQRWIPTIAWWPLRSTRLVGMFYALGSVVSRRWGVDRLDRAPTGVLLLVMLLGFGIVAALAPPEGYSSLLGAAVATCGTAASVGLAVLLSRFRGWSFVRTLGLYSLEIFVAHTIASAGLRILLQKGLRVDDPATHIVVGTLGGLLLPLMLIGLCRRFGAEWLFRMPTREGAS